MRWPHRWLADGRRRRDFIGARKRLLDSGRLFRDHLADAGVCVFTMHGRRSLEWIKSRTFGYHVSEEAQDRLVLEYETTGYGHVRYTTQSEYGISLASEAWVDAAARRAGPWTRVLFKEHGWDNHQDVYAFVRD